MLDQRVRLVADALAVGVAGSVLFALVLVAAGQQSRPAAATAFAVGALALGIGVLGWSGSVMAGEGIETMQSHLDTNSGWTETKSRRAMSRIAGFGAGFMLGSSAVEVVVFNL